MGLPRCRPTSSPALTQKCGIPVAGESRQCHSCLRSPMGSSIWASTAAAFSIYCAAAAANGAYGESDAYLTTLIDQRLHSHSSGRTALTTSNAGSSNGSLSSRYFCRCLAATGGCVIILRFSLFGRVHASFDNLHTALRAEQSCRPKAGPEKGSTDAATKTPSSKLNCTARITFHEVAACVAI